MEPPASGGHFPYLLGDCLMEHEIAYRNAEPRGRKRDSGNVIQHPDCCT